MFWDDSIAAINWNEGQNYEPKNGLLSEKTLGNFSRKGFVKESVKTNLYRTNRGAL